MSRQLINEYRGELDRLLSASGSKRESVVREAFKDLLKRWGKSRDLVFLAEHEYLTARGERRYMDGALVHSIRVPFGYWEAKDTSDDLDAEIAKKQAAGYPRDNIVYEDTRQAVLIQRGREVVRAPMADTDALFHLLETFFGFEREAIRDFNKAVKQFAADLPAVLGRLREIIAEKRAQSFDFATAEKAFLDHAREAINPAVSEEDVQEMLIQHVLTEDIFAKVFDNPDFHRRNNVAAALYALEEKLFGYGEKQRLLAALAPYYSGISSTAALIESHSEKQGFLKGLYENFYKVYNPKAADRLGVVYTPGEIVRFMIRSADWLCEKHFGKNLIDPGVEILDPATGTGTFIVELLEHFRGNRDKLAHKYQEELHANEVAILPYYVANLNIEATYQAISGQFAEFPGLVFVDTLDNVDALGIYSGHQHDLLGSMSDENVGRIKRQNSRKISVIIGNPPYNANQQNENDNNKNRAYARVDQRIKQTYIKASTAQKTKLYDMYARFHRWASDRLGDEGVVGFVTNRSFIESRTFDGFRKVVAQDFNDIWVVDLGGDVRANPKLSGTKHNVFGIQTGIAICFLVRREKAHECIIRYVRRPETDTAEDKLSWLSSQQLKALDTTTIRPNSRFDWINVADDRTWDFLLPLADPRTKSATSPDAERAVFKLYSLGIITQRDEWAYAEKGKLEQKVQHFINVYEAERLRWLASNKMIPVDRFVDRSIKWTAELERDLVAGRKITYNRELITKASYRPFSDREYYYDSMISHSTCQMPALYPVGTGDQEQNRSITTMGDSSGKPFLSFAINKVVDLNFVSPASGGTRCFSRYRYTKSGGRVDNITDWALNQFVKHYGKKGVSKDAIFHYVYAVLHDPVYRETYALNLKREFPRIPFYPDFVRWAAWGEELLALHIGYEKVEPWAVERIDIPSPAGRGRDPLRPQREGEGEQSPAQENHPHPTLSRGERALKPILRSDPEKGVVIVDSGTRITGIPREAWDYRLGNRSAIDWVLDQHKEKKPRDPTIAAKFNTYRFADYKESMIDLLARVVRVSVETVRITGEMREAARDDAPPERGTE